MIYQRNDMKQVTRNFRKLIGLLWPYSHQRNLEEEIYKGEASFQEVQAKT